MKCIFFVMLLIKIPRDLELHQRRDFIKTLRLIAVIEYWSLMLMGGVTMEKQAHITMGKCYRRPFADAYINHNMCSSLQNHFWDSEKPLLSMDVLWSF